VESALINAFACFQLYTTNKNFVFHNTNLAFKNAIIYNFIGNALGICVDKGILVEQPIRTRLNTLDNLSATRVVNENERKMSIVLVNEGRATLN
jgi:hypothetical protein